MNKVRTAVVILNWNGKHLLERFLPGVIEHTPGYAEIVVADNASKDGSLQYLEKAHPGVRIISLDSNYGYAGGYNRALKQVDADIYILLNSDIDVRGDWVSDCLEIFSNDDTVAAVQPKILSLDDPSCFEYAGAAGGHLDRYGYPFCRGRILGTIEQDNGQYDQNTEIFWASGAALFVRADAFHGAGGFDEGFFAHMEEIDLCWRFYNMGYRVISCPSSVVYHLGGASLSASNPHKTFLNFRNGLWMMAKNLARPQLIRLMIIRPLLDLVAACRFLALGRLGDFAAVFRAYLVFLGSFRRVRRGSRNLQKGLPPVVYPGSIVFDYFFKGRKRFYELSKSASTASR